MPMPFHFSTMSLLQRVRRGAALALVAVLLWAALAPVRYPTRERTFVFPRGAAILRGEDAGLVPAEVQLTLGVRDVLLLLNRDIAPHVFGQVLVLPGHAFRLPFEQAGDYVYACDAAPGHAVTVRVGNHPDPGWARLGWRLRALAEAVRTLPIVAPDD
ncbi:hypothetical protein ACL58G_09320 [Massilia sp. GER05]|uniref:cupredoxin domain-containing protein n=1 Tax=Massilia sp. GER05 TaxID=3394605 RepID=UPI003F8535B6